MTKQKYETQPNESGNSQWKAVCISGGVAVVLTVLTALAEMIITFLPGGYTSPSTVLEWFALLQTTPFLGLRNLGLLNIVLTALSIPLIFSLYWTHRKRNPPFALLAVLLSFLGLAVFYATNRAFPMLELSMRYASASHGTERAMLEAAGQALLSVGQSHTPGTFLAFSISELAGILMAIVVLRARLFNPVSALAGLMGYACLFMYEILSSFVPAAHNPILILAMVGGLANLTWYMLAGIRLFQLGNQSEDGAR
jgi:hypothetical protein